METASHVKLEPGTKVRILNPVLVGTVTEVADKPSWFDEFWHTIQTKHGKFKHLGCCLEKMD